MLKKNKVDLILKHATLLRPACIEYKKKLFLNAVAEQRLHEELRELERLWNRASEEERLIMSEMIGFDSRNVSLSWEELDAEIKEQINDYINKGILVATHVIVPSYMNRFEAETNKKATWRGRFTKGFTDWINAISFKDTDSLCATCGGDGKVKEIEKLVSLSGNKKKVKSLQCRYCFEKEWRIPFGGYETHFTQPLAMLIEKISDEEAEILSFLEEERDEEEPIESLVSEERLYEMLPHIEHLEHALLQLEYKGLIDKIEIAKGRVAYTITNEGVLALLMWEEEEPDIEEIPLPEYTELFFKEKWMEYLKSRGKITFFAKKKEPKIELLSMFFYDLNEDLYIESFKDDEDSFREIYSEWKDELDDYSLLMLNNIEESVFKKMYDAFLRSNPEALLDFNVLLVDNKTYKFNDINSSDFHRFIKKGEKFFDDDKVAILLTCAPKKGVGFFGIVAKGANLIEPLKRGQIVYASDDLVAGVVDEGRERGIYIRGDCKKKYRLKLKKATLDKGANAIGALMKTNDWVF